MSIRMGIVLGLALFALSPCAYAAHAAKKAPAVSTPAASQKLQACLKKAHDLPDEAAADAGAWMRHGGGENAHICRAFALFNGNEFDAAAREFAALGAANDKKNKSKAVKMHVQAGLSYTRAKDYKNADAQLTVALTFETDDPDIWYDRATARGADQRYWDAISDLNHALAIMPDMSEALRLRGQAWVMLGNSKNAAQDFMEAEKIDAVDKADKKKP